MPLAVIKCYTQWESIEYDYKEPKVSVLQENVKLV